jgi:aminoglycoside 6-adenylyltransferase
VTVGRAAVAYQELEDRLCNWAQREDNLRVVLVFGSRARGDHAADEWSDLDVLLLARDPDKYRAARDWVPHIGTPWLTFLEPTPDGNGYELRVLFEGGLDVDFCSDSIDRFRQALQEGLSPVDADLLSRGVRVLVDKDNLSECLATVTIERAGAASPNEPEFLNAVNDFWFHAVWTAKRLRRGELWRAKYCCDVYLKQLLLRMLVWHARASRGPQVDTWMGGRFLSEWADPRALDVLPAAFARYDEEDIWRALAVTMELFRWLTVEAAELRGYEYPHFGDDRATEWVQRYADGANVDMGGNL